MRRAERVVYVYVGIRSQSVHEFGRLFLFALVETQVFEKHAFAVFQRRNLGFRVVADYVFRKRYLAAEQFVEARRNGGEGKLFHVFLCLFKRFRRGGSLFRFGQSRNLRLFLLVEFELFVEHVVRFAHVRAKNHFRAVLHQVFNGGKRALNTVFVGDDAVFHGNVEVAADKDFFALDVDVSDCFLVHNGEILLGTIFFVQIYNNPF